MRHNLTVTTILGATAIMSSAAMAAQPDIYVHLDAAYNNPIIYHHNVITNNSSYSGNVTYTNDNMSELTFGTGLSFGDMLRIEINLARGLKRDIKAHGNLNLNSETSHTTLFTQAFVDFGSLLWGAVDGVDPYVFAGYGRSRNHLSATVLKDTAGQEIGHFNNRKQRTNAYRYGAGIAYHLNASWAVDLQWQHNYFGHAEVGNQIGGSTNIISGHNIPLRYQGYQLGFRYYYF